MNLRYSEDMHPKFTVDLYGSHMLEYQSNGIYKEEYRSGHNEPDSKSGVRQRTVGSNPTSSAKIKAPRLASELFVCNSLNGVRTWEGTSVLSVSGMEFNFCFGFHLTFVLDFYFLSKGFHVIH